MRLPRSTCGIGCPARLDRLVARHYGYGHDNDGDPPGPGERVSAVDLVVGYPVHAVARYASRVTERAVTITDWQATCGATGTTVGRNPFGLSGSARWRELCRACWPARHATQHPTPVKVDAL
jgi:hypothetical protein